MLFSVILKVCVIFFLIHLIWSIVLFSLVLYQVLLLHKDRFSTVCGTTLLPPFCHVRICPGRQSMMSLLTEWLPVTSPHHSLLFHAGIDDVSINPLRLASMLWVVTLTSIKLTIYTMPGALPPLPLSITEEVMYWSVLRQIWTDGIKLGAVTGTETQTQTLTGSVEQTGVIIKHDSSVFTGVFLCAEVECVRCE